MRCGIRRDLGDFGVVTFHAELDAPSGLKRTITSIKNVRVLVAPVYPLRRCGLGKGGRQRDRVRKATYERRTNIDSLLWFLPLR